MKIQSVSSISGRLRVPGDKSISHRAVMFGAIADGTTIIQNFLESADCLSTIRCFSALGIRIENVSCSGQVTVRGRGLYGLRPPETILDVGNSGTTMRLLSGILCGQPFASELTGDASIRRRPMNRILEPLTSMGANICSRFNSGCAPLLINQSLTSSELSANTSDCSFLANQKLSGIHYLSPVASAQVKSSVLLAGLYAEGETSVTEPYISRNHTELMLRRFGAEVTTFGTTVTIQPQPQLHAIEIQVPGDISSAAYFIAAAAILPDSELLIEQVGINPTRDGILRVCKAMGVNFSVEQMEHQDEEVSCNLRICSSQMHGCIIEGEVIPALIDELPIIAVMACFAEGETIIRDAGELKVKETNRMEAIVQFLSAMGADITETPDGFRIRGKKPLHGARIESGFDHRIAMSAAIAALAADGATELLDAECVSISYPSFFEDLKKLCR